MSSIWSVNQRDWTAISLQILYPQDPRREGGSVCGMGGGPERKRGRGVIGCVLKEVGSNPWTRNSHTPLFFHLFGKTL